MLRLKNANADDEILLLDPLKIEAIYPSEDGTDLEMASGACHTVAESETIVVCLKGLWTMRHEVEVRKPGHPVLFVGMGREGRPEWGFGPNCFDGPHLESDHAA